LSEAAYELSPPPLLGESTEYVCTQLLGMPDEEFVQLMQEGAFD
jgi:crotonobetainyl-CoA:carnitine CoA-transferase CaiB-like acyl-CoA transferase